MTLKIIEIKYLITNLIGCETQVSYILGFLEKLEGRGEGGEGRGEGGEEACMHVYARELGGGLRKASNFENIKPMRCLP